MLLSTILLAALGVAISTTLLLLSISSAQTSAAVQNSAQAKSLSSACAELALQQLGISPTYLGSNTTPLFGGTCAYNVSAINASTDKINATGTVGQISRKTQIIIAIPSLSFISWQEVSDFP